MNAVMRGAGGALAWLVVMVEVAVAAAGVTVVEAVVVPAQAQAATLVARQTNVFGNFVVGDGPVVDSGSFSEFLTTAALAYARQAQDAGAVNGVFNGRPVVGSASFASAASFAFDPALVVGAGEVEATGATAFDYVSLASNAQSSVRLTLGITEPTVVTLSGSIVGVAGPGVGSRTASATASLSMNGVGSWNTASHQGDFLATRTVLPGFYEIRGSASSTLNGTAAFDFQVALSPVPEPAGALLLAAGLLALGRRRAVRWAAGLALGAASLLPAHAQGLTLLEASNLGTDDYQIQLPQRATRFESQLTTSAPVLGERTASIDLHLAWAIARDMGVGFAPMLLPATELAWSMVVRVDDPLEQGYVLDVTSRLRGTLGGRADMGAMLIENASGNFRFGYYEAFDPAPSPLDGVGMTGDRWSGPLTPQAQRLEIARAGSDEIGRFRGTRSFLFLLEPVWPTLIVDAAASPHAYAWQQFGLELSGADWAFSHPADGADIGELGQFFRVTATFADIPAVPEPAAAWLMAAGSAWLLWRRRAPRPA